MVCRPIHVGLHPTRISWVRQSVYNFILSNVNVVLCRFLSPVRLSWGGGLWRRLGCQAAFEKSLFNFAHTHPIGSVGVPFGVLWDNAISPT